VLLALHDRARNVCSRLLHNCLGTTKLTRSEIFDPASFQRIKKIKTLFKQALKSRLVAGFSGTGLAYFW